LEEEDLHGPAARVNPKGLRNLAARHENGKEPRMDADIPDPRRSLSSIRVNPCLSAVQFFESGKQRGGLEFFFPLHPIGLRFKKSAPLANR
jgi:hypothetical protein